LQNPSQTNGDNIADKSCETCRNFRKKGKYMKDEKICKLDTNNEKIIRDLFTGINKFERDFQPETELVKDENCDPVSDSHSTLSRFKNYFYHLLNIGYMWLTVLARQIYALELLVPQPLSLVLKYTHLLNPSMYWTGHKGIEKYTEALLEFSRE
jgi:hypothetical protein